MGLDIYGKNEANGGLGIENYLNVEDHLGCFRCESEGTEQDRIEVFEDEFDGAGSCGNNGRQGSPACGFWKGNG